MSFRDLSKMPDYSSPDHAPKLIERIKAFWESKGLPPPLVEPVDAPGDWTGTSVLMHRRVDIRSNMRNGLPVEAAQ